MRAKTFFPAIAAAVACLGLAGPAAMAASPLASTGTHRLEVVNGTGDCAALSQNKGVDGQPFVAIGCSAGTPSQDLVFAPDGTVGSSAPFTNTFFDGLYSGDHVFTVEPLDSSNGCMTVDFTTQQNVEWEPCTSGFQQLWVDNEVNGGRNDQWVNVGATDHHAMATFLCSVVPPNQLVVAVNASCTPATGEWVQLSP
jgi:hypothetical protein